MTRWSPDLLMDVFEVRLLNVFNWFTQSSNFNWINWHSLPRHFHPDTNPTLTHLLQYTNLSFLYNNPLYYSITPIVDTSRLWYTSTVFTLPKYLEFGSTTTFPDRENHYTAWVFLHSYLILHHTFHLYSLYTMPASFCASDSGIPAISFLSYIQIPSPICRGLFLALGLVDD